MFNISVILKCSMSISSVVYPVVRPLMVGPSSPIDKPLGDWLVVGIGGKPVIFQYENNGPV